MSKSVGKHLPGTVPSPKCSVGTDGVHIPDPTATEWCINCEEWLGDEGNDDPGICYQCGDMHAATECTSSYVCDICSMDGPMDGEQFDYTQLDAGIRNSVKFLRNHGFWTTDSGDGVSKFGTEAECCAMDFPHVFIVVEPRHIIEESRKLATVLAGHGIQVQQQGLRGAITDQLVGDDDRPSWDTNKAVEIEASYDPVTDIAVLMVSYISDELLNHHGVAVEGTRVSN